MGFEADFMKIAGDVAKNVGDLASSAGKGVTDAASAVGNGVSNAANTVGSAVQSVLPGGEKSPISEEAMLELLDICYTRAIDGVPNVSKPIEELSDDYASKYDSIEDAAHAMVNMQLIKNTTSGFLSGISGFLALPVTLAAIPANISNVLYVQVRMVAALAQMGGYDIHSDQVQTMVYVCLTGSAASNILKEAGIKLAGKLAHSTIQKIPGKILTKINQAVGFRLVTKFGETGIVNLGKMIPVVGGVVGGGFDFATTRTIADVAFKCFIANPEGEVIDDETVEIIELEHAADEQCCDGE